MVLYGIDMCVIVSFQSSDVAKLPNVIPFYAFPVVDRDYCQLSRNTDKGAITIMGLHHNN